jgi:phage terminase large subunit
MQQIVNKCYLELWTTLKHYVVLMGGRGAGRSTVVSQYFLSKLIAPEYFRGAIMRFILTDIRNSCFQEILDRAEEQGILDKLKVNTSQMTIEYGANAIHAHAFRKSSGDQKAKLKSLANYSEVWVEEADEVPEADFMQLDDSLRTTKAQIKVILTLNAPAKVHWIIKRWFNLLPIQGIRDFFMPECHHEDVLYIRTDWHDNAQNISEGTKKRYEEYKETKPDHYWNMIKGYVPETVVGKIYSNWRKVNEIPFGARLIGHYLDFGFDPDPLAVGSVYFYNGVYIIDEKLYVNGMLNVDLARHLKLLPPAPIIADSAEPKSIAELARFGVTGIIGTEKGADSVYFGIKHVQGMKISYTSQSINVEKEYESYAWKVDKKTGETLGIEDPGCANHHMSGIRYFMMTMIKGNADPQADERRRRQELRNHNSRPRTNIAL